MKQQDYQEDEYLYEILIPMVPIAQGRSCYNMSLN